MCKQCGAKISRKARNTRYNGLTGLFECNHCGALQGRCYKGQSYQAVMPFFSKEDIAPSEWKYFDIRCLGSDGITRRHGWFNPNDGKLMQTG